MFTAPLLALVPILSVIILLLLFQWPAKRVMPVGLAITILVAMFGWQVPTVQIIAAMAEGSMVSFSILWILFGVIFMQEFMTANGAFTALKTLLSRIRNDKYIFILIICWFFGALIEGIAGFGTPAAICAPLLIAIGFKPLESVVLSLMANSIPVIFGAAGTPILIGFQNGLQQFSDISNLAHTYIHEIGQAAAFLNIFGGSLMPLLLLFFYAAFFDESQNWKKAIQYGDIALFSGISFTCLSWIIATYIGPEFPSMLSAPLSFILTVSIFNKKYPFIQQPDSSYIHKKSSSSLINRESAVKNDHANISFSRFWLPYVLVIILLLVSRLPMLGVRELLLQYEINWPNIFSTSISASFAILYSPGTFFLLATFILALVNWHTIQAHTYTILTNTGAKVVGVLPVMFASVMLVRVFVFSDVNMAGYASMPETLAHALSGLPRIFLPPMSVVIGALGSFLSGSATFSNMMFAPLQYVMALSADLPPIHLLALQCIGASVGNMICILNIIAACAVVNLKDQEGLVLTYTLRAAILSGAIAYLGFLLVSKFL